MTKNTFTLGKRKFSFARSSLRITVLWLLLLFCWGGTKGRFSFGLSMFDLVLTFAITELFFLKKVYIPKNTYLLLLLVLYGTILVPFNQYVCGTSKTYQFYITEIRFFLYIPILYLYVENCNHLLKLKNLFFIHSIIFIIFYILNRPGTIIYSYFNEAVLNTNIEESFQKGERVVGLPIIPLTTFFIIHVLTKPIKNYTYLLYFISLTFFFIKTGSRTNLLFGILPFILLFINLKTKRKIKFVIVLAMIIGIILPMVLQEHSLTRISLIFNPGKDPSVNYRLLNYIVMIEDLIHNPFNLIFGNGIGANYIVNLAFYIESFFLDNTFITLIYKIGLIGLFAIFYFIWLELKQHSQKHKFILLLMLIFPAITSYHIITQPAYFMSFFILNKSIKSL